MKTTHPYRLGAGLAVGGVLLTLLAFATVEVGVLDPFADISSARYMSKIEGAPKLWLAVHLVIAIAVLIKLGGLLAIGEALEGGTRSSLVRMANAFAGLGAVLLMVTMAFDGYVHGYIADRWQAAGPVARPNWESIFGESLRTSYGVELLSVIALLGFAPIAYGLAMLASSRFPRWLGQLGVISGAGGIVTAAVLWLAGPSGLGYGVLYPLFAVLLPTIWLLRAARDLWQVAEPAAPGGPVVDPAAPRELITAP